MDSRAPTRPHPRTDSHALARDARSRRAGVSIVEVTTAVVVLAVGLLGLAGATAYIAHQVTLADVMTERAAALQTVIERIESGDFDTVGGGRDSVGMFSLRWSVVESDPQTKLLEIVTVGPGPVQGQTGEVAVLGPNVSDTFHYRAIRP